MFECLIMDIYRKKDRLQYDSQTTFALKGLSIQIGPFCLVFQVTVFVKMHLFKVIFCLMILPGGYFDCFAS